MSRKQPKNKTIRHVLLFNCSPREQTVTDDDEKHRWLKMVITYDDETFDERTESF